MYPDQEWDHHSTALQLCKPDGGERVELGSAMQQPLSRAQIAARTASASTAAERCRWQVISLLVDRAPLAEVVAATGCRPRTIRHIAQRYREFGPAALVDRRVYSRGATPLLTPSQQHELSETLQRPPPDGGSWTGPKVAQWIAARTGQFVHRQRGWEYLRRLQGATTPMGIAGDARADQGVS